ncbi:hypothetical protein [Nonomuraea sp. NPDC049480]|uniref:hypothetical protein n=1 Tax=Nonomuraea sp. NPDC049480 TaxID=3364353 RepID=UPI0037A5D0CD
MSPCRLRVDAASMALTTNLVVGSAPPHKAATATRDSLGGAAVPALRRLGHVPPTGRSTPGE